MIGGFNHGTCCSKIRFELLVVPSKYGIKRQVARTQHVDRGAGALCALGVGLGEVAVERMEAPAHDPTRRAGSPIGLGLVKGQRALRTRCSPRCGPARSSVGCRSTRRHGNSLRLHGARTIGLGGVGGRVLLDAEGVRVCWESASDGYQRRDFDDEFLSAVGHLPQPSRCEVLLPKRGRSELPMRNSAAIVVMLTMLPVGCGSGVAAPADLFGSGTEGPGEGRSGYDYIAYPSTGLTDVDSVHTLCVEACAHIRAASCETLSGDLVTDCPWECRETTYSEEVCPADCVDEIAEWFYCIIHSEIRCDENGAGVEPPCAGGKSRFLSSSRRFPPPTRPGAHRRRT
jgi:hypothetical protein